MHDTIVMVIYLASPQLLPPWPLQKLPLQLQLVLSPIKCSMTTLCSKSEEQNLQCFALVPVLALYQGMNTSLAAVAEEESVTGATSAAATASSSATTC